MGLGRNSEILQVTKILEHLGGAEKWVEEKIRTGNRPQVGLVSMVAVVVVAVAMVAAMVAMVVAMMVVAVAMTMAVVVAAMAVAAVAAVVVVTTVVAVVVYPPQVEELVPGPIDQCPDRHRTR